MAESIAHITREEELDAVLKGDVPVVVDFWAEWCGPCRMIAPLVEALAEEYKDTVRFVKVDVDQARALAARYGVMSIPTLLLFKNGQIADRAVGYMPKDKLKQVIEKALLQ